MDKYKIIADTGKCPIQWAIPFNVEANDKDIERQQTLQMVSEWFICPQIELVSRAPIGVVSHISEDFEGTTTCLRNLHNSAGRIFAIHQNAVFSRRHNPCTT